MADAMLPAELAEVTDALEPEDELLTADELASLSLFEELKKTPSFQRFPGTTVLRKCQKGRVLVRQGSAGATAYSILSAEDVVILRKMQIKSIEETIVAKETGEGTLHQYYKEDSKKELEKLKTRWQAEVDQLERKVADCNANNIEPGDRHVASAELVVNIEGHRKPGLLHRISNLFSGGGASTSNPDFIPIDGPADIDIKTKRAPLHEGELFGEMSCMNRAPRSATVVAEEDCYMLEMLRNVLDMLHKDPKYKEKLDRIYRERVLDGHIRRLPIFQNVSDEDFADVKERIELVDFEAGSVVFEEFEDSDSFFVVRSGLVKVVKNAWTLARKGEFKANHWKEIWKELADQSEDDLGAQVWAYLSDDLQAIAKSGGKDATDEHQDALVAAFNRFIGEGTLHTDLGKFTIEIFMGAIESPQLEVDCEHFPEETKKWSELESRTFHRAFLEDIFEGGMPRRAATSGARKILRYMGRGEGFGELGVVTNSARSATIFAYDHPDGGANMRLPDSRTGAIPSRVELIKISREDLLALVGKSKNLKATFDNMIQRYSQPPKKKKKKKSRYNADADADQTAVRSQSPEFEQMGLIQGQRLMLIDLDKCTRCNQCVDACVAAHHDGRTRLYLDGPRFEKYLVPLTCRSCLDPVCMIGCPVGSINRGDNGEIQIRDWCIGCTICADQCPYGSIQMSALPGEIELTASQQAVLGDEDMKTVNERAVVCDLCSSLPSQDPSCVYACPHDAAFRVNALDFFLEQ
jgi:Fe-S-cluster-containing dehydrogenase component/CRP-like cAMP-binding protein